MITPDIDDVTVTWVVVAGDGASGGGANTTDEVFLINTIKFYERYGKILSLGAEDFFAAFPLVTQEDANLLNADMLRTLHELKPTIHIVDEIYKVGRYIPKRGDLWVDPTDYSLYICEYDSPDDEPKLVLNPSGTAPYQDAEGRYLYWVQIGGGAAGGGGNRVFVQMDPPDNPRKGDLWVDESTYYTYVWKTAWVALTGDQSAMGKKFEVHVGVKPPLEIPSTGDLWFDTEMSEMRIYLADEGSNSWVPVNNGGLDRRNAIYTKSFKQLNEKYQELHQRLMQLEGNTDPTTENFTYPIDELLNVDSPGVFDSNSGTDYY